MSKTISSGSSFEGRKVYTRCILNPRFEPVISKLIERLHEGSKITIREVVASTKQDVGDPHIISVPGLTLLDGGLKEGRHRYFFKRVKIKEKKFDAGINLQELLDDYDRLIAFDNKIATYLVIDELIISDYTNMGKIIRDPRQRPHDIMFRRMPKRKLPPALMEDSQIDEKCLLIALDAIAIKERLESQWQYIGADVETIDLPRILPGLFDRSVDDDDLIQDRHCYIPPYDPLYRAMCFRATGKDFDWAKEVPDEVKDVLKDVEGEEDE